MIELFFIILLFCPKNSNLRSAVNYIDMILILAEF